MDLEKLQELADKDLKINDTEVSYSYKKLDNGIAIRVSGEEHFFTNEYVV